MVFAAATAQDADTCYDNSTIETVITHLTSMRTEHAVIAAKMHTCCTTGS